MTYHDDTWILARPEWNFDAAAEPLAAAAEACRTDPFVIKLSCELERDVLRIAEMLDIESCSVSLELCPETFAKCKAIRLHVHFAIVLSSRARVERDATLRWAGVNPVHAKQAGPLQSVRARNFAPLHYYLQMPNQGSVWFQTILPAVVNFP